MGENFGLENMKIFHFEEVSSTNTILRDMMADGCDVAGTVVVAGHQTAGKGMGENRWESEPNKNLLFSIALNVSFLKAEEQFKISQAVAVAILNVISPKLLTSSNSSNSSNPSNSSNSLNSSISSNPSIKWPNDVYVGSKKLAGMLIQNTISGMQMQTAIIGIGLNVNQLKFGGNIPNPVSLKMLTGNDFDLESLLDELIVNINDAVEDLRTEQGKERIDVAYRKRLFRCGEWAEYEYEGEIKSMIINGYDKYGRLCLSDKNGHEVVCDIKEIRFIL